MEKTKFLNTVITKISLSETISNIGNRINENKKTHIVFLNALKIYELSKNEDLQKVFNEAELVLADGVPIVWSSKIFGINLPGRVNGTDLFELLIKYATENDKKIFLLGAKQANLEKLIQNLISLYPKLEVESRNGYFSEQDEMKIIEQINNSGAFILFLGISSPKKELWVYKYKSLIKTPIIMGVGGSFDVLAEVIPRAPLWMQKSGLEWIFRLIKEPRRMFRRYLVTNTYFVYLTMKYVVSNRIF